MVDRTNCEPTGNPDVGGGDCTSPKSADALEYTVNEDLESIDYVLGSGGIELARGSAAPAPSCEGTCCPGIARIETSE